MSFILIFLKKYFALHTNLKWFGPCSDGLYSLKNPMFTVPQWPSEVPSRYGVLNKGTEVELKLPEFRCISNIFLMQEKEETCLLPFLRSNCNYSLIFYRFFQNDLILKQTILPSHLHFSLQELHLPTFHHLLSSHPLQLSVLLHL